MNDFQSTPHKGWATEPGSSGSSEQPAEPAWVAPTWAATSAAVDPIAPAAARPAPPARRSVGPGFVLAAVIGAAALSSGGTYLVVNATTHQAANPAPVVTPAVANPAPANGSIVDIAKAVSPAVVTIVAQSAQGTGTGSGVIFDANGLILTNHHVVAGDPQSLTVHLNDGREFDATIYGIDTLTDLAIVKVEATGLPTAPIGDSSSVQVGQQAIAIGSPLGTFTDSVTSGIISAVGRSIPVDSGQLNNLIQTDTAINPGNSGGPLLDPSGKVIGINTAVAGQAQNIGFAIPIDIARPLMVQASAGQPLARPWLGVQFESIDPALKKANSLPVDNGAWISNADGTNGSAVVAGSPADTAGVQDGDIITAIDGTAIDSSHPLDLVMSQLSPGKTVTLKINRNGQTVEASVTLGTRPANQ